MPVSSVERPVSALRQRMLEEMAMRGLRSDTQHDYIRVVRSFAAGRGQPHDTATAEDIRRFQVHQRESGVQPPTINCSVSALRFFFTVTLDRPDLARRFTVVPYSRRVPTVLSAEEVTLLLQAASAPKYKAAFATAYGAGLRVSEVVALKVGDIDSERMLLRVERGKGGKSLPSRKRGAWPCPIEDAVCRRCRMSGANRQAKRKGIWEGHFKRALVSLRHLFATCLKFTILPF